MKKKLIVAGMAAVLMTLGLVFAACSNPLGGGGEVIAQLAEPAAAAN
jgi:hypothetical protein